ncbi:hypothetical protein [Endozoicomonas ascidiicola]|uniref:hypothetical protein n=1 Tax=Endozoicomonas ascidiicola TaxID=1698521 RepID=UPI000833A92D|nr:hypothetical protein [Endozoicomonas ascidiicola]
MDFPHAYQTTPLNTTSTDNPAIKNQNLNTEASVTSQKVLGNQSAISSKALVDAKYALRFSMNLRHTQHFLRSYKPPYSMERTPLHPHLATGNPERSTGLLIILKALAHFLLALALSSALLEPG